MKPCPRNEIVAATLVLLTSASSFPANASPIETYLALGDSIAFGETNVIPISFGDQGYVKPFADFLATRNGGVRPNVVNLAFPGETSTSFFTGVSPPGDAPHTVQDSFNLNYQANPAQTQNGLMLSTFAAEAGAGRIITHVSFSLGTNDLIAFEKLHLDFFTLTSTQQHALITSFFTTLATNYIATLTEIRAAEPHAQLLLLNTFNAAAIFGPTDPFNIVNQIFDTGQTALIDSLIAPFDATLVDINKVFQGHETEFTSILSGDSHPNDAGYLAIADQMIAASIPEPDSSFNLVIAMLGAATWRARLRKRSWWNSGPRPMADRAPATETPSNRDLRRARLC
jgi:lysophospholipase L1-like esterase